MKGKAFSLLVIASLLASTLMIGTAYGQGYIPGSVTKFNIKLPDCTGCPVCTPPRFANCSPPTYDIGDKFNITVEIQNVTDMTAFGVTIIWNSTFNQFTGNYWYSPAMGAEKDAGRWSTSFLESWSNDTILTVHNVGTFIGYAQTATYPNTLTGTYELVILEFQIMAYGPSWFYLFKDTGPLETQYASYMWTASGWMDTSGDLQDYDVLWALPELEDIANAELYMVPEFLAYLLMPLFLIATIIAVVLAKIAWSKRPRGRVDVR